MQPDAIWLGISLIFFISYIEKMSTSSPRHHTPLIAALALLLYAGTLDNAFVLDDHTAIRDNPLVHRADPIEIFTSDYWSGYHADHSGLYRPLTTLSYALQYRLCGPDPFSYHLVNILLHTLTTLLLYRLVRNLIGQSAPALAATLLFAVHPAISEAVCAAVGRAGEGPEDAQRLPGPQPSREDALAV